MMSALANARIGDDVYYYDRRRSDGPGPFAAKITRVRDTGNFDLVVFTGVGNGGTLVVQLVPPGSGPSDSPCWTRR